MTQQLKHKLKAAMFSCGSAIAVGLMIAAFYVVDKNIAMGMVAIAVGIAVFLAIIDSDFRRAF